MLFLFLGWETSMKKMFSRKAITRWQISSEFPFTRMSDGANNYQFRLPSVIFNQLKFFFIAFPPSLSFLCRQLSFPVSFWRDEVSKGEEEASINQRKTTDAQKIEANKKPSCSFFCQNWVELGVFSYSTLFLSLSPSRKLKTLSAPDVNVHTPNCRGLGGGGEIVE